MNSIIIYHPSNFTQPIVASRDAVYEERYTTYLDHYVASVDAFIFSLDGKVFLEKRAKHKKSAPGLYNTSFGGHIDEGETPDFAFSHEALEEFGHPPIIVPEGISIETGLQVFRPYLNQCILVKQIYSGPVEYMGRDGQISKYIFNDYIGVFTGTPNNLDGSAEEHRAFTLEEIESLFENPQNLTTNSIKKHFAMQKEYLYAFREMLRSL